jgi:pimeloyl-ACP methyl ester carboxylesterase
MAYVDRGGVRVCYEVHNPDGSKTPLLLSHGFGATAGMWAPNVAALSSERPVVAWSQRGHGDSDSPSEPAAYGHELCLGDMAAILDAVGATPAILVGMSLGGYLSLAFTLAHPERVAALVLVDTGPGFRSDKSREQWNEWARQRADEIDQEGALGGSSSEVRQARHRDPHGVAQAARYVLTQADSHIIDSLPSIAVPTLVVVGSDDTNFLGAADYMQQRIPGARKVVIDNAGHASNIDQPAVFNTTVIDFLESLPVR